MKFLRQDRRAAEQAIAAQISSALTAGKRVLWLVSGGSNVSLEVEIMDRVRKQSKDKLDGLAVLPMDERYGKPGHAHSNTQALRNAGFDPGSAIWIDVLAHDASFERTVRFYGGAASMALTNAALVIGQFGLGPDAHVAGVLPNSPATDGDEATVIGYEWSDYARMTLSPFALRRIQTAYVLAYGDNKLKALERLRENTETFPDLPAKLLYDLPEVFIYNNQLDNA